MSEEPEPAYISTEHSRFFALSPESLSVIDESFTRQDWLRDWQGLSLARQSVFWWRADMLREFVRKFSYASLKDIITIDSEIKKTLNIGRMFPPELRTVNTGHTFYRRAWETGIADADKALLWIEDAVVNGWSARHMAKQIRISMSDESERAQPRGGIKDESGYSSIQEVVTFLDRHPVEDMDIQARSILKLKLEPIVEIYQRLTAE